MEHQVDNPLDRKVLTPGLGAGGVAICQRR
jgi:hypothetical protein